ncbi:Protein of unknown function DUF1867 [Syntrophomonas zehnderi OL-4]|uniref:Pyruvate kinase C-terminal domain-containing protein n=1 Tax=Syntrophomonas zehnderi OL-4 TaxID=690567 RepID=A0A0E4GCP1_9FIRM|nr:pyruvate kinase alpha/beta domain-containing protein [Syntrophomonas zehnderi]CFX86157.1 Protein of unknown function DUF1867 [Syntrophomonas zehnderi OL-4]
MFWENAGAQNTAATLQLALEKGRELGINTFTVASCTGETAQGLVSLAKNARIICVTHQVGFQSPGVDEMESSTRESLKAQNVEILTTTHLFAGVDRALRFQFNGIYPAEIMAYTLRIFGQGVKVAVEVACMALDAGLIPHGQDIISIAGSQKGADAALVIRPAHSAHFFETQVKEIICMPRNK